ncbi:MAG: SGNH/GDSL hydrolase family protein [Clostridia bacterium]|nr:SGNH/GDSL hydrolase family protein [Clostridia bacterium]
MNKQTFEASTDRLYKKESIEWLRIWCENTHSSLPRVALIGDSITEQVFEGIKKELEGTAIIDFLVTSYSILSPAYTAMVKAFVEDTDYALVYFNYGLHAANVSIDDYETVYCRIVAELVKKSQVLIASTTVVHTQQSDEVNQRVQARNACAQKIAKMFGLTMDDGYGISVELGEKGKIEDGVHLNEMGKERLAKHKAELIKKLILK